MLSKSGDVQRENIQQGQQSLISQYLQIQYYSYTTKVIFNYYIQLINVLKSPDIIALKHCYSF